MQYVVVVSKVDMKLAKSFLLFWKNTKPGKKLFDAISRIDSNLRISKMIKVLDLKNLSKRKFKAFIKGLKDRDPDIAAIYDAIKNKSAKPIIKRLWRKFLQKLSDILTKLSKDFKKYTGAKGGKDYKDLDDEDLEEENEALRDFLEDAIDQGYDIPGFKYWTF